MYWVREFSEKRENCEKYEWGKLDVWICLLMPKGRELPARGMPFRQA